MFAAVTQLPRDPAADAQIIDAANRIGEIGTKISKQGGGPGSVAWGSEGKQKLEYEVITTIPLAKEYPDLFERFYAQVVWSRVNDLLEGEHLPLTAEDPQALNVNVLRRDKGYECHYDQEPVVCVYFPFTVSYGSGRLVIVDPESRAVIACIESVRSTLAILHGRETAHLVEKTGTDRISVPMVFHPEDYEPQRDENANDYLYSESE